MSVQHAHVSDLLQVFSICSLFEMDPAEFRGLCVDVFHVSISLINIRHKLNYGNS